MGMALMEMVVTALCWLDRSLVRFLDVCPLLFSTLLAWRRGMYRRGAISKEAQEDTK